MGAQDNDGGPLIEFSETRNHLEAIESRHLDIKDENIWVMLEAKMKRLQSIGGFSNNGEASDL
jgi:hypothetical protein